MYVVVPSIRYSPYISMRLAQVKKVMLNFNCHTIEQSIKLPSYILLSQLKILEISDNPDIGY